MPQVHDLGAIEVKRKQGDEAFHDQGRDLPFNLTTFWQWSCSDLVSNATRGILAEYLVAQAVSGARGVRDEWAPYDLKTADGTRIEVKSAAYIQSWHQERPSRITFRVPKTRAWDRESNRTSEESRRQADVHVFALLAHADKGTIDPLDVSQWEFFVVPTAVLDSRTRSQHSITLPSLRAVADPVAYSERHRAVQEARCRQVGLTTTATHTGLASTGSFGFASSDHRP